MALESHRSDLGGEVNVIFQNGVIAAVLMSHRKVANWTIPLSVVRGVTLG